MTGERFSQEAIELREALEAVAHTVGSYEEELREIRRANPLADQGEALDAILGALARWNVAGEKFIRSVGRQE